MRRRLGPLVEIQLRVERKGSTFGPSDPGADPADDEEPAGGEEEEEEAVEPLFLEETDGSVGGAVLPAEGACTGLGAAGTGVASVEVVGSGTTADVVVGAGSVGSGSGTVGTVVMVGTGGIGGIGTGSASA